MLIAPVLSDTPVVVAASNRAGFSVHLLPVFNTARLPDEHKYDIASALTLLGAVLFASTA
jgi:hypothetical protein